MELARVAVAGTGTMGRGLVEWLAGAGVPVVWWGRSDASLAGAFAAVDKAWKMAVRLKRLDAAAADAARGLVTTATDPGALARVDWLVETVVEDLAAKRRTLARLVPALPAGAVVTTNTSALAAREVLAGLPPDTGVGGTHFMNPVAASALVEVAWRDGAPEAARKAVADFLGARGKTVLATADAPGQVVNRLLMALVAEALRLADEGVAAPADIDLAARLALGHPMGPLASADFIGLDVVEAEMARLAETAGERYTPGERLRRAVREGRLGRKNGRGLLSRP